VVAHLLGGLVVRVEQGDGEVGEEEAQPLVGGGVVVGGCVAGRRRALLGRLFALLLARPPTFGAHR
jgi:hypothetical protein